MAGIVGGCLAFSGCCTFLGVPQVAASIANRTDVGTTTQKISKLAANVLKLIGIVALSVSMIVAGVSIYSFPSAMAIGVMAEVTIKLSAPYFLTAIGGFISSRVIEILIGE